MAGNCLCAAFDWVGDFCSQGTLQGQIRATRTNLQRTLSEGRFSFVCLDLPMPPPHVFQGATNARTAYPLINIPNTRVSLCLVSYLS